MVRCRSGSGSCKLRFNRVNEATQYHEFSAADPADDAALEALGLANLPIPVAEVSQIDVARVESRLDLQAAVAAKLLETAELAVARDKAEAEERIRVLADTYAIDLKAVTPRVR